MCKPWYKRHNWSNWQKIIVTMDDDIRRPYQDNANERVCSVCNLTQRIGL